MMQQWMCAAVCVAALSPAPAITWNDVTLGAPISNLRPLAGDPLRVVTAPDGATRIGRYWLPGLSSTVFLVVEKRGYIQAFSATTKDVSAGGYESVPADPSGVRLGDSMESVKKLHPDFHAEAAEDGSPQLVGDVAGPSAGVVYEFQGGRVRSFQWGILDVTLAELPALADPAGDSTASAVLDLQKTESQGVNWETLYLGYHRCDGRTRWDLVRQSVVRENGRIYDRLNVRCPSTKQTRDFYFDITSYYGKPVA
jgi:hypothetical protein